MENLEDCMVNHLLISRIVSQKWNTYIDIDIDPDTKKFLEKFLFEYDSRVKILAQYGNDEERIKACKELKEIFDDSSSLLYIHLKNCVDSRGEYLDKALHILINDVFKIRACKQLEI